MALTVSLIIDNDNVLPYGLMSACDDGSGYTMGDMTEDKVVNGAAAQNLQVTNFGENVCRRN